MLKVFVPAVFVDRVTAISAAELESHGIRGLLLDLDNTLLELHAEQFELAVIDWARGLRAAGIALCVVSNGPPERTGRLAAMLEAPFVARAQKPLAGGVRRGLAVLGLPAARVAFAGDQIFTDVWVGNRLGLLTILVRPISPRESPWTAIKRPLERWVLGRIPPPAARGRGEFPSRPWTEGVPQPPVDGGSSPGPRGRGESPSPPWTGGVGE